MLVTRPLILPPNGVNEGRVIVLVNRPVQTAFASPVVESLSPAVLRRVLEPTTGVVLWRRATRVALHRAALAALAMEPFCRVAEGMPGQATRILLRGLSNAIRPLGEDMALLGRLFATLTGRRSVRLRLEHVVDDSCRQYHVDALRLRLLCTYAGLGTDWIGPAGNKRQMALFQVGGFKGSKIPGHCGPDPAPLSSRRTFAQMSTFAPAALYRRVGRVLMTTANLDLVRRLQSSVPVDFHHYRLLGLRSAWQALFYNDLIICRRSRASGLLGNTVHPGWTFGPGASRRLLPQP
jgi:hypothetical protein